MAGVGATGNGCISYRKLQFTDITVTVMSVKKKTYVILVGKLKYKGNNGEGEGPHYG